MVSFPPCKINLGLHVFGKELMAIIILRRAFIRYHGRLLEVIPAETFIFTSSGNDIAGSRIKTFA